jgi:hypothetical protein
VQHLRPDILVLNEVDYQPGGEVLAAFQDHYLAVGQLGEEPLAFAHHFAAATNTGEHSGFDLDNRNGVDATPGDESYGNDAFGFGEFPGKFGMAVFSQFPFALERLRTLRSFLWKDMPGNAMPPGFFSPDELEVVRLSSKSHWDLPVVVAGQLVHLLVSHPTPPSFDGPEDRNGRRNHDEIRLWADYLSDAGQGYLYDDDGVAGGLATPARFLVLGDLNASPDEGDSFNQAVRQLLDHRRVDSSFTPRREGGSSDTAAFLGGIRVDYVLPSAAGWHVGVGAVFWPASGPFAAALEAASDHRPVYLDLTLLPLVDEAVRNLEVSREGDTLTLRWDAQPATLYAVAFSRDLGGWEPAADAPVTVTGDPPVATATATLDGDRNYYRIETWFPD